ncbi:transglutaminase-like domain-containing protein [Emticicia sp. 17c]|uniref:transglutaminase-like domain-containing protein n=1 Tax=Emticicia sp. 17c TaxID=3127704 RepID=UPI00301E1B53
MKESEIKALVTLLDDDDIEVVQHVEKQLRNIGGAVIPMLEDHWQENGLNPLLQKKIEDLIHDLQYNLVTSRLLAWKNDGHQDLLEGMWLIATYQYPDLSLEKLRQSINDIYFDVWLEFRDDLHPHDQVRILNQVFFEKYKFVSNTKNFHSPANSMLNQVFEQKKGNPISLCVIYMLIAKRLGMPVSGVNLPSLFVLTYKNPQIQFYINVFNRGLIFSKIDISNYIKQMHLVPQDSFYQPCTNLEIICRVLRNLIVSFEKVSDLERVQEVEKILKLMME